MSYNSYDRFVATMNQKARSGAYDNKHSLEDLEKRAKGGDQNARKAFLMRTGRDVDEPAVRQTANLRRVKS